MFSSYFDFVRQNIRTNVFFSIFLGPPCMVPGKTMTMGHIIVDRSKFLIGLCKTGMLLQFCHGYVGFYPKVNVDLLLFYITWNMPPYFTNNFEGSNLFYKSCRISRNTKYWVKSLSSVK